MLATSDHNIDHLPKRFYVDWINLDGDLEVTPFWAASAGEALAQVHAWSWLKPGERLLGVSAAWDAVVVDDEVMLRREWFERQREAEYVLAMGAAAFPHEKEAA